MYLKTIVYKYWPTLIILYTKNFSRTRAKFHNSSLNMFEIQYNLPMFSPAQECLGQSLTSIP